MGDISKQELTRDLVQEIETSRTDSTKELRVEVVSSVGLETPTVGRIVFAEDEGRTKVGTGSAWV